MSANTMGRRHCACCGQVPNFYWDVTPGIPVCTPCIDRVHAEIDRKLGRTRHGKPKILRSDAPGYITDATFGRWRPWFTWRPVITEQGKLAWLRQVWRRTYTPPVWANVDAGWEYSFVPCGAWEVEGDGAM